MCGLAGYIDFTSCADKSNEVMLEMLRLQKHRGPDDAGIIAVNTRDLQLWKTETEHPVDFAIPANMVLGFNRLSVLDLSANGHQPMLAADNKVALMLNGEIYNAFDFKEGLEKKGYIFRSQTDTEVVLNLYLEYGFDKMIRMLNGMFAIVLLDLRKDVLFLARDRFGIKPLYVLRTESRFAFSSEIKSFKALPDFKFELAEEHLDEYLLFRNLINRTLFKNINNLTPGEYWQYSFTGEEKRVQYYDITDENKTVISGSAAKDSFAETLQSGVQRQMISDVKLGCQLSGGVDSSMVSYYAQKGLKKGQLDAVSVVFDNPSFSEKPYIDYVSNSLELKSHQFSLRPDYYLNKLEEATWHFENPLNHPNTIGIYLLSAEAKKHVTVLLSGEGADEILAGYGRFIWQKDGLFSRQFLSKLKKNSSSLKQFLGYYFNKDQRMIMSSVFSSLDVSRKLKANFNFQKAIAPRYNLAKSISSMGINKQRKYEIKTYLPDLLMRQDKMSMAHSIENRVPFLDNDLVTAALRLDETALINHHNKKKEGKYILKQICSEVFDEDFAFRSKMGFGIPLKEFMQAEVFQQKMYDQWLPGIKERGIFSISTISSWTKNVDTLGADKLDGLWQMLGFEIWAQQYLDEL